MVYLKLGYSAVAGVIPAFCKRNDIIVIDEGACFAIQRGAILSRSRIFKFKHNDIQSLKKALEEINLEEASKKSMLTRRFIITEGLFTNHGTISPLPDIVKICKEYKWRLILDESQSFGTLGENGYGAAEHWKIPKEDRANIIFVGSLSAALGSAGGFTAGNKQVIEHQVLSNQAYCYSASLPAIFATAAHETLLRLPKLIYGLHAKIEEFDKEYIKLASQFSLKGYIISGQLNSSPIRFLHHTAPLWREDYEELRLGKISKEMFQKYSWQISVRILSKDDEHEKLRPAVRICVRRNMNVQKLLSDMLSCLPVD